MRLKRAQEVLRTIAALATASAAVLTLIIRIKGKPHG